MTTSEQCSNVKSKTAEATDREGEMGNQMKEMIDEVKDEELRYVLTQIDQAFHYARLDMVYCGRDYLDHAARSLRQLIHKREQA